MKETKNSNKAFIVSVLIHILLMIWIFVQEHSRKQLALTEPEVQWVDIETLDTPIDQKAQIVQQDKKSMNDQVPKKDYKLSQSNQDVLKETKAQKHGAFKNRKNTIEAPNSKPSQQAATSPKQNILNALKPSLYDNEYSAKKLAAPAKPALSGAEISQSDDYLKDIAAGAETLLRTREFVYYSYYNRIKSKLRQHWEPRIKKKIDKILRKGRRIASTNDKITRLVITLDQTGELKRIQVRNASGYNDLDDAAIEAFRAAAPFPNPPSGIVNPQGEVAIPWDFVLET